MQRDMYPANIGIRYKPEMEKQTIDQKIRWNHRVEMVMSGTCGSYRYKEMNLKNCRVKTLKKTKCQKAEKIKGKCPKQMGSTSECVCKRRKDNFNEEQHYHRRFATN